MSHLTTVSRSSNKTQLSFEVSGTHDDVMKWKHFPRHWPFVRGIHRSPVNSPHKGQWRGVLMFSLICARINGWVNNREAGDLRLYRAHYDVIVMVCCVSFWQRLLYFMLTCWVSSWLNPQWISRSYNSNAKRRILMYAGWPTLHHVENATLSIHMPKMNSTISLALRQCCKLSIE